jgi:hypothetical protein
LNATVSFGLLESTKINLEVCDLLGNIFYSVSNFYEAGEHFITLETKDIPSGSYICRLLSKRLGSIEVKQIGIENFVIEK